MDRYDISCFGCSAKLLVAGAILLLACGPLTSWTSARPARAAGPPHAQDPKRIGLDDARYIAGENINDSLRLRLYSHSDRYLICLERIVGYDERNKKIVEVLDTIRYDPPTSLTSFVRCTYDLAPIWIPMDMQGVMPPNSAPWTVREERTLVRMESGTPYDCDTEEETIEEK